MPLQVPVRAEMKATASEARRKKVAKRLKVVNAFRDSGNKPEWMILTILPVIKRLGVPLIAFTGNSDSAVARIATVHLDIGVPAEACPLNLAPTASTTAALAVGRGVRRARARVRDVRP